jgi:hypothetical protein
MKRFLPVMAALLAVLLWLPAGALAYTITWGTMQPTFTVSAVAGSDASGSGPVTYPALAPGQYYAAQSGTSATDGGSSASCSWSVIVSTAQSKYLAGGGKDTSFTVWVKVDSLAVTAQPGVYASAGDLAKMIPSFMATREDLSADPILRMDVTWGGSDASGLLANLYLNAIKSGFPFPTTVYAFNNYNVNGGVDDSRNADSLANFINNPTLYWYLQLAFSDSLTADGSQTEVFSASADPWVSATLHLIEPNMTDPDPVPLPPSVLLLGSGILTLVAARRRMR